MKRWLCSALLLGSLIPLSVVAQSPLATEATLLPGMGEVHHPVATQNPEAQRFFDQGLALGYGFNHEEAIRSFQAAAKLDPDMAMAWWGVALALGTNYNVQINRDRELQAYAAIQKALALSQDGPKNERAYIEALATRYTNQPDPDYAALEAAYNTAMRALSRTYPDDLDAATLFAESSMNQRPWRLWNHDGTPAPGTEEIVAVLESVLQRNPNHIGANHLYIHAVEASPHPERGLASAQRIAGLAPGAGHLVHMPGHIYIRTGDHAAAVQTDVAAAAADEKYLAATHAHGVYAVTYYNHNLHFLAIECAMIGRYGQALAAAQEVQTNLHPYAASVPMVDMMMPLPALVMVRFARWDEILKLPQPEAGLAISNAIWRYARASAFAGRGQLGPAQAEVAELRRVLAAPMRKDRTDMPRTRNANLALEIASNLAEARLAQAQNNPAAVIDHLRQAVALQDNMDFNEPPDWIYPTRESLGAALLQNAKPAEAEKVFREDLVKNPHNPRSLFGLAQSLKTQGRGEDAAAVEQEFTKVWQWADGPLQLADLWARTP